MAHDGGLALGDYCQTLDLPDVYSGWTETEAVPNKAQVWVFEALQRIRQRLPFPLLGLDSDNGSEFVNQELLRYCQKERITFTRARPYRKNDNCYVEQKNYSVVRQTVGYQRFDTAAELMVLQQLYATLRLYSNFFQPTMKLLHATTETFLAFATTRRKLLINACWLVLKLPRLTKRNCSVNIDSSIPRR